ncbi:MAG: glucokinase, partial [Actinomycetota bacterium]|nr:glucokinase [Actinomycetota bacterium]
MPDSSARRPPRGRQGPSTIGVDIGGTKVLGGVVDATGTVLASERRPTPGRSVRDVEDTIVGLVTALSSRYDVGAVGIGAAGFVDADRSTVVFSPHLAWRDEPLREALQRRVPVPVVVDNDANAAALAECRFGAGAGHRYVLCVTLGTGIGGALVIDDEVFRGANGMAGEFGHVQVVPGGHRCECGNRGCWEQYASGNSLVRDARELVLAGSPVAHHLAELVGGDASRLTGPLVTEAARGGDPLAVELIADVGAWLGVGLAGMAAAFDPGAIIVGGGVSAAGDLLLGPTREAFSRTLVGRGYRTEPVIVGAALGPDAGFIGAADMARSAARRSQRRRLRRREPVVRRR